MSSSIILSVITFVYGFSAFLYIAAWVFKKPMLEKPAVWAALVGVAGCTAGIILRWVESYRLGIGHAPLSNLYESLIFFSWVIVVIYLFIERKYENRTLGAFVMPIAFLTMIYASLKPDQIQPLLPALKSNWLIAHVVTCFIGYAAFAVAFGVSLMYLVRRKKNAVGNLLFRRVPEPGILNELNYQLVMFGFLFLSIGIITGAVWANSAWGRYWGWDPKETWSAITWLIYAALLHFRLMRGWGGERIAFFSIIGFMAVLFTYFGVNLLPGLHSYGQ